MSDFRNAQPLKLTSSVIATMGLAIFMMILATNIWQMSSYAQQAVGLPQILESEDLAIITSRGRYEFKAEIADEAGEQAKGLMFREDLAADEGMLFDFGETRIVTMWMKNTPLSLDMLFIRADGTIARIAERTTPYSLDVIASGEPLPFVLELRGGVANLIGAKAGDRIEHRLFSK